jgi:PHD/YefM family antitoxin component YafN of YafNO toxin-antitoxin module
MLKAAKIRMIGSVFSNSVSISLFNKGKANRIFEEVKTEGIKAVLKNNKVIGVIVSPDTYEEMVEKLEDYELLLDASKRMSTSNKSVSMEDAMKMLNVTQEELDETNVDIVI